MISIPTIYCNIQYEPFRTILNFPFPFFLHIFRKWKWTLARIFSFVCVSTQHNFENCKKSAKWLFLYNFVIWASIFKVEQLTLCGIFVLHMLLFYAEITFAFVGQQCAFSTNSFQFNVPARIWLKLKGV